MPLSGFTYVTITDNTSKSTAVYVGGTGKETTTRTIGNGNTQINTNSASNNTGKILINPSNKTGSSIFDSTGLTFEDINSIGLPEDPEFLEALAWMYTNKLTSLWTPDSFRPFDKVTREESSKIFGRFAKWILKVKFKTEINNDSCIFTDSWSISSPLSLDVFDACKLWLFKGGNGAAFNPQGGLTKAQSLAVLVRLFDNKSWDETTDPRFYNYYKRAYELEITKDVDFENFNRDVTRYEVALMIYRFNIKYKILKPQNDKIVPTNPFITTVPNSTVVQTGSNLKSAMILINSSFLSDSGIQNLPIDLLGNNLILKKSKINVFWTWNSNYVWFGRVYNEQQYTGSATFTILSGIVNEAYIRPINLNNNYYQIEVGTQLPYYTITEINPK